MLLETYLNEKSSLELHVVLLDTLMSIGPAEWTQVFNKEGRTDQIVKYLLALKDSKNPPGLRAASIQACAHLIS